MSKPTVKELKALHFNRGRYWLVKAGERFLGAFGYTYLPSNSGAAFARNYGPGYTHAFWNISTPDGGTVVSRVEQNLRGARSRAQADKMARRWFREQDVRRKIAESAK